MSEMVPTVIFNAWQTDSPEKSNRNAISFAISTAIASITADQGVHFDKLEATRSDDPGSPNIPQQIFARILQCDIFIADLTTINIEATDVKRKTANPNVLIELGMAVAAVGWSRVILLFNTAYGSLNDLPFDIDRQRVAQYRLREEECGKKTPGQAALNVVSD